MPILRKTGHQGDRKGRQAGQQQDSDQSRLATNPIAVMAEDTSTDRSGDKAYEEYRIGACIVATNGSDRGK
jgi:hypothetical protein